MEIWLQKATVPSALSAWEKKNPKWNMMFDRLYFSFHTDIIFFSIKIRIVEIFVVWYEGIEYFLTH